MPSLFKVEGSDGIHHVQLRSGDRTESSPQDIPNLGKPACKYDANFDQGQLNLKTI